jgi:signal transduction histidine kinase
MLARRAPDCASGRIRATQLVAPPLDPSERSARAVESIAALGEMTRGIAHDFRNILCMLASGLNIAEDNRNDAAKLALAMTAMREGVERGLKMTNRLLGFARHQDPKASGEDLNTLLAALKLFLEYGAGPGIHVILDLAPDLPEYPVDAPQLNAAILNLVVNARDAMPEGGIIRISTAAVAHAGHGADEGQYVRVRVRDNGAGMPPQVLARIFDPFFTTKGDGGTGLGIPQVHAWMRKLGGYVTVQSGVGKGTAFDLFFPVQQRAAEISTDTSPQLEQWADEGGATGVIAPPPHAGSSIAKEITP